MQETNWKISIFLILKKRRIRLLETITDSWWNARINKNLDQRLVRESFSSLNDISARIFKTGESIGANWIERSFRSSSSNFPIIWNYESFRSSENRWKPIATTEYHCRSKAWILSLKRIILHVIAFLDNRNKEKNNSTHFAIYLISTW